MPKKIVESRTIIIEFEILHIGFLDILTYFDPRKVFCPKMTPAQQPFTFSASGANIIKVLMLNMDLEDKLISNKILVKLTKPSLSVNVFSCDVIQNDNFGIFKYFKIIFLAQSWLSRF